MELDKSDFPTGKSQPGTIVDTKGNHFKVDTGGGIIKITEVQLEGKRRMNVAEFLRGHKLEVGHRLL
jgi:methionyl-tRNA formyltransferase